MGIGGKYVTSTEVKGIILGVRKVQDRGRVQIPKDVRDKLSLSDGDSVYWIELGDAIYVVKAIEIR